MGFAKSINAMIRSSSALAACCCQCECPPEFTTALKINGYTDGSLTACAECDASGAAAWNGEMPYIGGPFACLWKTTTGSIDGKTLDTASVSLDPTNRRWILEIKCRNGADDVWEGYKSDCTTPLGTYTRDHGCDAAATLEVVEA